MADIQWTDDKVGELIGLKNNTNVPLPTQTHTHTHTTTVAWRFTSSLDTLMHIVIRIRTKL